MKFVKEVIVATLLTAVFGCSNIESASPEDDTTVLYNPNLFDNEGVHNFPSTEITLRDYFAGQAMSKLTIITPEGLAKDSYDLADAMLRERAKRK